MKDIGVGIDIGTTGVKAIAVTTSAEIVFENNREHDLLSPRAGYAEEDPLIWWNNTKELLAALAVEVDCSRIAGIAFSGMVPTVILVDEHGEPLRNSIQQNDARAVKEINYFKQQFDSSRYFQRTGNTINQQVVFPKLSWLKQHEPESFARTRYVMGSYDYCAFRLCGNATVERNWALESGMWLLSDEEWDKEVLDEIEISVDMLPPVRSSGSQIGTTSNEVESETGLPAGIPVMCGIADHVASALATGVRDEGQLLLKLGGAGDILFATNNLRLDERLFVDYHPIPGKYLLNGCMAASGSVVKWLMNVTQDSDFERLTVEAAELGPEKNNDPLVVLPYFLGEKTPIFDTDARGVIFGLSLNHSRAHLFRAVLEAVAYGFRHHVDVIRELDFEIEHVFLSNGGARSPLWKQIVLDIVGCDGTYIPNHPGSCIGAAFVVLNNTIPNHDWSSLNKFLEKGEIIRHSPKQHQRYEQYYKIYRDMYWQLKSLFPKLKLETNDDE